MTTPTRQRRVLPAPEVGSMLLLDRLARAHRLRAQRDRLITITRRALVVFRAQLELLYQLANLAHAVCTIARLVQLMTTLIPQRLASAALAPGFM